jgi:hypothetical protein
VIAWTHEELDRIGAAEELQIAPARSDGTLRKPVTIWVVRQGNDLYVRSYRGPGAAWYRDSQIRHEGRIEAGGLQKAITFVEIGHDHDDEIDAAYREKYGRYAGLVDQMVSPETQATTIKLVPRSMNS